VALQVDTRVECACFQRMKLKHDKLLSSFAFTFNLRPYVKDNARLTGVSDAMLKVGRCRLTL